MISQAISRSPFLLGQILDWPAAIYPDKSALEWEGGRLTYTQLADAVRKRENSLAAVGVHRSERWGLLLGNCPDFIITLLALLRIGAVTVPLRYNLPTDKLGQLVSLTNLNGILGSEEIQGQLGGSVYLNSAPVEDSAVRIFMGAKRSPAPVADMQLVDLDPAVILLTSGSTGLPRGVLLEHHAILANLRSNIASLRLRDEDRTLVVLPLNHAYALVHQTLCHLMIGATVCLLPNALPNPVLHRYLEYFTISNLSVVPPVLQILVAGLKRSKCSLPALRLVTVGAAFADPSVVREFLLLQPHTQVAITYGLTEAGPRVSTYFVKPGEDFNPQRVGVPLPNVAVGLRPLENGIDEIVVRSRASVGGSLEYGEGLIHQRGGTVFTGDTGSIVEGDLYLKGRKSRIINRGGTLVGAEHIESVLLTHPALTAGRVEASRHPFWGEVPVALVTLASGAENVDEEALREYCASRLSVEERPFKFVIQSSSGALAPSKAQQLSVLLE